jgi:hypothetical protein
MYSTVLFMYFYKRTGEKRKPIGFTPRPTVVYWWYRVVSFGTGSRRRLHFSGATPEENGRSKREQILEVTTMTAHYIRGHMPGTNGLVIVTDKDMFTLPALFVAGFLGKTVPISYQ